MVQGNSLDILKDNAVNKRLRRIFAVAFFFKKGEQFSGTAFQEKSTQYIGETLSPQNCRAILQSFASKGLVQSLGRNKYVFQGIDENTFNALKNLNFDVSEDMMATAKSKQNQVKKQNTPVLKTAPKANVTPAHTPPPAPAGLSQDETKALIENLFGSFKAEIERMMLGSKINERLVKLPAADLKRFEALLDVFA